MLITFVILFFATLLALVYVLIRYNKVKSAREKELKLFTQDRQELTKYKELYKSKSDDFQSSIKYAKRLVDAIFKIGKYVSFDRLDYALFYRPKDIISGDFVWHQSKYDRHYFVVADCTGHGVPGAFMSIVSYNLFNQAVNEFGFTKPSEILNYVNEKHVEIFNADNEGVIRDGMDVGVCIIDTDAELIEYSGAMRPLYVLKKDGTIERVKGDRMSIGVDGYSGDTNFTDKIIDFESGDTVYLTTDGFVDQFGGPYGKKYKSSRFKEMLSSFENKDIQSQYKTIKKEFKNWKGKQDQIDDVTILAVQYK